MYSSASFINIHKHHKHIHTHIHTRANTTCRYSRASRCLRASVMTTGPAMARAYLWRFIIHSGRFFAKCSSSSRHMSSTCPGQGHRSRPKVNITGLSILVVVFIKAAHKFNVLSVTVSDVTVTRQVCPLLTMITINRSVVPHLVRVCVCVWWVRVGVLTKTYRYLHFLTHTHTPWSKHTHTPTPWSKHLHTHTCTHTTNTCITSDGLSEREERTQVSMQKRTDKFSAWT